MEAMPKFEAVIPEELMARWGALDAVERLLLKGQSVQGQQTEWIIRQFVIREARCTAHLARLEEVEKKTEVVAAARRVVTRAWVVACAILAGVGGPLLVAWLSKGWH